MVINVQYSIPVKHFPLYRINVQPIAFVQITYNEKYQVENVDIGVPSKIIGKVANWEVLAHEIEDFADNYITSLKPIVWRSPEEYENRPEENETVDLYAVAAANELKNH